MSANPPHDELEALWRLAPAAPPRTQLSARLLAMALDLAGVQPSTALVERARFDVELLYAGGAIDVWEYLRTLDDLDELDDFDEPEDRRG